MGGKTATGAIFNPHGNTAAARTWPMGTVLTVTNPKTGQSVTVTINDRGPFGIVCRVGARLDLAMGAAQRIGMHNAQYVCVSILKDKEQEIEAKMDATTATVGLATAPKPHATSWLGHFVPNAGHAFFDNM